MCPLPEESKPYNSADQEDVRKATSKDKVRESQTTRDIREVWGSPAGRRYLRGLLELAGVYRVSHVMGAEATHDTAFREGMRNLGLAMISDVMKACPEFYFLAQKEATSARKENETDD